MVYYEYNGYGTGMEGGVYTTDCEGNEHSYTTPELVQEANQIYAGFKNALKKIQRLESEIKDLRDQIKTGEQYTKEQNRIIKSRDQEILKLKQRIEALRR